ncbi:UDP-N-acetylmuramoyl-tripeptide--D-alanyl-D-alanine ligase [Novilysobacter spongiicola]|uniref:UDP-N-acetylmuramoyl-tripeptide--D-alanyl-D-alanine ligase n=1 Tax=Lysobacter spongiicola DSM 21749 TaxID=1122188 RepID=A0A1T4RUP7_9GAMM|nr:UDP-N-acetylmuramoyl-tripeptide--D-alanyl-D-alanine ligase [Lysobacter spongiicola]SKA19672.1 UDP-N-acetylmuramoyl-tripeptide--D-alanyl-D-alanine ligase [Lysobacter spongiicola DSM 21749]
MRRMKLSDVARMCGGRLVGADIMVDTVATDTRALPVGEGVLFVALKGANFDGHEHVAAAAISGVAAALVSRQLKVDLPQVLVADTERALALFAAAVQRERGGKVAAITGSNGKTTVKSLLQAILGLAGKTYATPGNRNNEIGLPLAVLDAPEDAEFSIYEMGTGKPGDIAYLTAVARPDVALVNNVAPAHLERMGSLLSVADTKAAVYDALPPRGVAVINADDAFAPFFAERAHGRRLIRFGLEATADVTARDIAATADGTRFTLVCEQGEAPVQLALAGRHNVSNAMAAAGLALGLGVGIETIARGLNAAVPVAGRLASHELGNGVVLVDDSYNANPGSLAAAIDTLAQANAEGWLVLGDMRELGPDGEAMHAEAGRRAKAAGIKRLFALGPLSAAAAEAFGEGGRKFGSHDALIAALREALALVPQGDFLRGVGGASAPVGNRLSIGAEAPPTEAGDNGAAVRVLVKGSRGSAMDRIVAALLPAQGPKGQEGDTDAA